MERSTPRLLRAALAALWLQVALGGCGAREVVGAATPPAAARSSAPAQEPVALAALPPTGAGGPASADLAPMDSISSASALAGADSASAVAAQIRDATRVESASWR